MWGVVLGVGKKREGNLLCHQISPDLEQYLSLAIGASVCFTLGACVQCIAVFGYFFSSCVEVVTRI